jgi:hypothetical protein
MTREISTRVSLVAGMSWLVAACSGAATGPLTTEDVGQSAAAVTGTEQTLDADFANCTEYAGLAPIPLANAAGLVPAPFVPASYGPGLTALIIRTATCKSASIEGGPSHPGTVLQVGININPPNNTGNINNYTLWYLTDSHELAVGLQRAGIRAEEDPLLLFDPTTNPDGNGHVFLINGISPPLLIDSPAISPTPSTAPTDFIAEWWQGNAVETNDMFGTYPGILFGAESPDVNLLVPPGSPLAKIIGGTKINFSALSVENEIPSSHLHVSAVSL